MENASKALLMAAGVLLAIIILSAFVMMYGNLSDYQNTKVESTREKQVVEFNNQYTTYDRKDIKGIDMCSLMNRVVDYNRRKSTEGTDATDEGNTIAYLPMKVTISFNSENDLKIFRYQPEHGLLLVPPLKNGKYVYEASKTVNTFDNQVSQTVKNIENNYGIASLNNFLVNIATLFPDTNDENVQNEVVQRFKFACKQDIKRDNGTTLKIDDVDWNDIKSGSTIRNDVYKYYEYSQFKKARFDCVNVEYDGTMGRIIEMNFEFTGKIQ